MSTLKSNAQDYINSENVQSGKNMMNSSLKIVALSAFYSIPPKFVLKVIYDKLALCTTLQILACQHKPDDSWPPYA